MPNHRLPNLVLITADQWRGDCLGFLPPYAQIRRHPVMTPHVNQLAAEGAAFSQAYADCPVCMPQRVTFLTGQTGSRFGMPYNFNTRPPIDSRASLPGRLTCEAGYQTKAVGKMHFVPERARYGFEHITLHPNDYVNWLEGTDYPGTYRGHGLGGNEVYPTVAAHPEPFTHTHWIIDQAIHFLSERDPEAPFFLWIVFEAPHSPFDPPAPYDRMYDNFAIPDPIFGTWVGSANDPPMFHERRLAHNYEHLTPEILRETRRRYYGQISHIDYQLGRFLGELRTKGLYDETAIIFTADHGEHLGDHNLFGKTTFLRGSADVPLIIRLPAGMPVSQPGLLFESPVLTADLCPTLLALGGLSTGEGCDGQSLLPLLQGEAADQPRLICGEYGHAENATAFATDGRTKYIYYSKGGVEQLFDLQTDPDNLVNLVDDEQYASSRAKLRQALIDYLTDHKRPLVREGSLVATEAEIDEAALRARNPFAWRGPMHYGQGYGGGW